MPAWSLSGSLLLLAVAPAAGGGEKTVAKSRPAWRAVDITAHSPYRMPSAPTAGPVDFSTDDAKVTRIRSTDRVPGALRPVTDDPHASSIRALLRDRRARRGGALDARVEWRLSGSGSDLGLGGGLKRVVDTILND